MIDIAERDVLYKLYWEENLSTVGIAKRLNIPNTTVRRAFHNLGIPLRNLSEAGHLAKLGSKNPNWHGGKKETGYGYIKILMPQHPYADCIGYVCEHRLVMEKRLGRYLLPNEKVHHINGIKDDNRPENLELISPDNHNLKNFLCSKCELRKEIRLLRLQIKKLQQSLQFKLEEDNDGAIQLFKN